jgi:hypothetical protein
MPAPDKDLGVADRLAGKVKTEHLKRHESGRNQTDIGFVSADSPCATNPGSQRQVAQVKPE